MLSRQGWLLLFLGAPGGKYPVDQIRVMKGMFLLSRTQGHPTQELYRFEPYDYGPFDARVYRDLDLLQLEDMIRVTRLAGSSQKRYELTDAGQREFALLEQTLPAQHVEEVRKVKKLVTDLSFDDLLKKIYTSFPEFAVNSVARVAQQGTTK